MTKSKKILSNILSLSVAEIASKLLVMLFTVYLAKIIGTRGFGIISYSQALIAYFIFFVTIGLDTFGQREAAKGEIERDILVNNIFTMRALFSVVAYAALSAVALLQDKGSEVEQAVLIGGMSLFSTGLLLNWYFQGKEKMNIIALRQISIGLINFAGVVLFIKSKEDTVLAVFIINIGTLINTAWLMAYYHFKVGRLKPAFDMAAWKSFLKISAPIGLFFLIVSLYQNLNITMLGAMRHDFEYESGIFGAAYKIFIFAITPSAIIQGAYFPLLSRVTDIRRRMIVMRSFLKVNLTLGIFFTLFLFLFAKEITDMAFGKGYEETAGVLGILSFTVLFSYLATCFTIPFISWSKEKYILVSVLAGVVINFFLNYFLIPPYGVYGAATATLSSEIAVFSVMLFFTYKKFDMMFMREQVLMALLGAAIGAGLYYLPGVSGIPKALLFTGVFVFLFVKSGFLDLKVISGVFRK